MAISKNVNFKATVQGVTGVLKDFKKFEEGGKNIFKALRSEAKLFAIAFTGIMGGALAIVDSAVQKFAQWEKQGANTNRMLKLNSAEWDKFIARIENSVGGGGALAVLPDAMNQVVESLYDYTSALGTTQDSEAIFRDIEAAAKAAAMSGSSLNDVMSDAARIARTAGRSHGSLAEILGALTAAEQDAVGTLPELAEGVNRTIGPMHNLNATVEETAAFMAQLSGTGIGGMNWAARALRMVGVNFERNRELLKGLGVESDNFIGMMHELAEIELTQPQKEALFGGRYQAFFTMMLDRMPALDKTIRKVQESTGLLDEQFNAFTYTTISEQTRATNELEVAQIKLGERMKRFGPMIANVKAEIQLTIAEMAEWALKHPSYVAAILAGLMAIRTAYLAIKASSPWGMALAVIEYVVGGIIALGDALEYTTQEQLDDVRATKQLLEEQRAAVGQTREEVKARIAQAEATHASAERMEELNTQYDELTDNSERLTKAITAQTIAEAQLTAQLAAETAAEEVGHEQAEKGLGRILALKQEEWKTEKDRLRIQEAITDASVALTNSLGDEAKLNEVARDFLKDAYDLSEGELDLLEAQIDSREEVQSLLDAAKAGILASQVIEGERTLEVKRQADKLYEQAGILETIQDLEAGTRTITADGLDILIRMNEIIKKNAIERAKELIISSMVNATEEQRLAVFQRVLSTLEEQFAVMDQRLGDINITAGLEYDDDTTPGGDEEKKAEIERNKTLQDEKFSYTKVKIDELSEYKREKDKEEIDASKAANSEATKGAVDEFVNYLITNLQGDIAKTLSSSVIDVLLHGGKKFGDILKKGLVGAAEAFLERLLSQAFLSLISLLLSFGTGGFGNKLLGGLNKGGKIPGFAEGGYVKKPTLGIFGERGGEYLIPEALMHQRMSEYGAIGAAMAAAEVSGQSIQTPSFVINESQPNVTVAIAPEGLVRLIEKGQRARVIRQGQ